MRGFLSYVIALHEEEGDRKETSRRFISDFLERDFSTVKQRRETFINWPLKNISPNLLAKDGLFYTRDGVKCQCLFCFNVFDNWENLGRSGTKKKHYEISPKCQQLLARNKAMDFEKPTKGSFRHPFNDLGVCKSQKVQKFKNHCKQEAILINNSNDEDFTKGDFDEFDEAGIFQHFECEAPKYASKSERLKSFKNWPETTTVRQSPEEFAEAGFIFTEMTDHVICFHCGLIIFNFENEDDLWIDHALCSPYCRYLLYKKNYEFVKEVHRQYRMDEKTGIFHKCEKEEERGDEKKPKKFGGRYPLTVKSTFLDSAFPESPETESVTNICKKCLVNPVEAVYLPCKHMTTCSSCVNKNGLFCLVCEEKINIAFKTSKYEGKKKKDETIVQERKENKEGKEKCLKCSIEPPEVIFLPCTHMILCASCSLLSENCPLCKEEAEYCFKPIIR